jgi:hypothetical protein
LKKIDISQFLGGKVTDHVFGPSSDVFIGSFGYPDVFVGPLASVEDTITPIRELYTLNYDEIIRQRSMLVRGNRKTNVKTRIESEIAEVALSTKAIDVEEHFTKTPKFDMTFSSLVQPMGASAPLKSFRQAENPVIPKKVDAIIHEDILATDAVSELMRKGFDNYYITKIFSIGSLGKEENKKIVPSRWSITALDDIIAKQKMAQIRDSSELNQILVFSFAHLGNSYHVLLLPGTWEFENFESWSPNSLWAKGEKDYTTTEEYEPFDGRSDYATNQVGGYYASRFAVVEYLYNIRKQARVVVFREISEEYMVPLGVAQVREGVRGAVRRMPMRFQNKMEAIEYLKTELKVPMSTYLMKSKILRQSRLTEF